MFVFGFWSVASATIVNVANLYGTATANHSWGGQTPDNTIDGSLAVMDYWNAGSHGTVSNPNWVVVDLGSAYDVGSIDLFWAPQDGLYAGYTTNYNVYYGNNNTNWTLAGSGVFVDEDINRITDSFSFGPTAQSMQYVMYEVDGGTHWSGINEISVFADDGNPSGGAAPVPEPATMLLFGTGLMGLFSARFKKK